MKNATIGYICFGEINTPIERLQMKHDEALAALKLHNDGVIDGGLVIDDPAYETADAAYARLAGLDLDCLVVCVAGWVPTHAVIRVTDHFRHVPMILWGLCGWKENGRIITTAEQAGTTALRPAFEALGYTFKYIYNIIGKEWPMARINAYIAACHAKKQLRSAHVGTMGYRDMLLYGTQYEGNSMRGQIGVEVEPYEMLEMVRTIDTLDSGAVAEGVAYVKQNWVFQKPCDDEVIEKGVKYALAIAAKIRERGWEAITLIDVDGMKKLEGFPPAMVFMIIGRRYNIPTTPENDVMGNVTQIIAQLLTGQCPHYMEYYEFFPKSVLIGVPDYVPENVTKGDVHVMSVAFGLLNASLLNVSKCNDGKVTCVRLLYTGGKYALHMYTGTAKQPQPWNEYGWDDPAPQLVSLEVELDSPVEEFANKVGCQHVIVTYGDNRRVFEDWAKVMGIEVI